VPTKPSVRQYWWPSVNSVNEKQPVFGPLIYTINWLQAECDIRYVVHNSVI